MYGSVMIYINEDKYGGKIVGVSNPELDGRYFPGSRYESTEYPTLVFEYIEIECFDLKEEHKKLITKVEIDDLTLDMGEKYDCPEELEYDGENGYYDWQSGSLSIRCS